VAGKADCIVSGDSDLLDMVAYEGIPVYRAAEFLKLFAE
jgi:predicted nucleic acid-binding protein